MDLREAREKLTQFYFEVKRMKYFKAFHKGMICNDKKYQENAVFEEDGGKICENGVMHFCETPFDTLDYYPLIDDNGDFSEFAEVEAMDDVLKKDNKRACRKIRIGAKLSFKDFIKAGIDVLIENTKPENDSYRTNDSGEYEAKIGSSGDGAKISSSGNSVQIGSSGYGAQIGSAGDLVKIGSSGNRAQIGSSGDSAQIGSSGDGAKISSSGTWVNIGSLGDWAQISSSGNEARIGSSGDRAKISSSGNESQIKMTGRHSVASAIGLDCQISGKKGDWIVLAEWKRDETGNLYPACVKTGQIDGQTLKEDTMYTLKNGEFVMSSENIIKFL